MKKTWKKTSFATLCVTAEGDTERKRNFTNVNGQAGEEKILQFTDLVDKLTGDSTYDTIVSTTNAISKDKGAEEADKQ